MTTATRFAFGPFKRLKETQVTRNALTATAATALAIIGFAGLADAAQAAPVFGVTLANDRSEIQFVEVRATGGQYRLRFGDGGPGVAETADIAYNASAAQVGAALNALTNISAGGGSVSVLSAVDNTGAFVNRVTFNGGPLAETDVPTMVGVKGTSSLTGPFPDRLFVETADVPGMRRNDQRIDYTLSVANTAPVVAGNPSVGDTLGCNGADPGKAWAPAVLENRPSGFGFRWVRNGTVIAGETAPSYVTGAADAGAQIQCLVTATSQNGLSKSTYASMTTTSTMGVSPAPSPLPPAPVSAIVAAARPGISPASGAVGVVRTCTNPSNWTAGGTPVTFSFQWLRNGEPIDGQTASTYTPTADDDGKIVQCMVTGQTGTGQAPDGGRLVGVSANSTVGTVANAPSLAVTQTPNIVINAAAPTVEMTTPAGQQSFLATYRAVVISAADNFWSCVTQPATGLQPAKLTCSNPNVILPGTSAQALRAGIAVGADAPQSSQVTATVSGHGAPTTVTEDGFEIAPAAPFGITPGSLMTEVLDPTGQEEYAQAGGHPYSVRTYVAVNHHRRLGGNNAPPAGDPYQQELFQTNGPVALVKQLKTDAPQGFVGNPLAPPVLCEDPQLMATGDCPLESVIGEIYYRATGNGLAATGQNLTRKTLVAIEPERGVPAQFAVGESITKGVYVLDARLRPEDGYAVSIDAGPLLQSVQFMSLGATICGYGATAERSPGVQLLFRGCKQPGDAGAYDAPLFTMPTACSSVPLQTRMTLDSWSSPGVFHTGVIDEPLVTGCDLVPFTPTVAMSTTSDTADSPSGFDASIDIPVAGMLDPDAIAQSHLRKTVVKLPEGVSVNPSAATGLAGCSDAQLGLKTDSEPECPDGSKIGTVEATTPVLEDPLTGVMVLRTPSSTVPESGDMLRVALIVRNRERGVLVKLPGSATADPDTGRLVATFDDNPQQPIGHVEVHLRGGDRGMLAMGKDCGEIETEAALSPWSWDDNARRITDTPTTIDQRCDRGFAPTLAAGSSDDTARGQGGTYSFKFSRQDGEQWLRGLTAKLPKGLLASVKDVPLCANGLADAGNCPAASKIGMVDAKAGSGDPFVLEEKGEVFLTEGYKGGAYGLAVKIRPVAGPFRGEHELSPIVVRQAIHVDRTTAEVTAVSDPFPLIHHGIPLRAREVNVLVNRNGFMLNPSDCTQKQSSATLLSDEGATAGFTDPFQVSDCAALPFRPKLSLALTGRRQIRTGKHPGVKAKVTQKGTTEAGIEQAVVRLPKSLALDVDNAQALCEFEAGTKPDLENHCPKGSIVGRARAKTPLLKNDLVGNVYFVKNVRKDPKTGNEIRTLPMIVVALRGEIAINLRGESSTTKAGKLVNTFASVPDAPISQFNLNIKGGKTGILAVTRTRKAKINLCAGRHIAEADIDGHNGRRHDRDVRMKTPCRKTKKAGRTGKAKHAKGGYR